MADNKQNKQNKQYITKLQENGTVLISEDVIASIVTQAVADVEGIVGINSKPASELADMIGKRWGRGIRVSVGEDNATVIDVDVIVRYGHSVVTIAAAAQKVIIAAFQPMTSIDDVLVNVHVCGIVRQ